ncbi:RNA-directed DNA polymerase, eukaryota, reverse transcriptase zinc-binding domain protein [Tanacetum coccineum]
MWLALQKRLQTHDVIAKWNNGMILSFSLCGKDSDYVPHLFFQCDYSGSVMNKVGTADVVYNMWSERNLRTFQDAKRDEDTLIKMVKDEIKFEVSNGGNVVRWDVSLSNSLPMSDVRPCKCSSWQLRLNGTRVLTLILMERFSMESEGLSSLLETA